MAGRQVRIVARIRPLMPGELQYEGLGISNEGGKSIVVAPHTKAEGQVVKFAFTSSYGPESTQEEIFTNEVEPMIDVVYSGITVTVFAYGVTSSGKTHTMQGSLTNPGIIPRAVEAVFSRKSSTTSISLGYMEIYKDEVYDLLTDRENAPKLPVRENQKGQVFVANQIILPIDSEDDFNVAYSEATKRRSVASTNLNRASSRSHAVLTLEVKTEVDGKLIHGKLNLVDLAGSENNKMTGNDASRMAESSAINKSLSVLGQVVHALNLGASRIPYRNSKLTRILQDALGGSSVGLLICNVAPAYKYKQDTHNTLNFATRTKNIENKPTVNQRDAPTPPKAAPHIPNPTAVSSAVPLSKPAAPRPSIGLRPPSRSRVPRPSSVVGSGPLLPDIREYQDRSQQQSSTVLTEEEINERIEKAVAVEVAKHLAERERQLEEERQKEAELPVQLPPAESHRSSTASRISVGDQQSNADGVSCSHGEQELLQRLQDLEDKVENGNVETQKVSDLSPVSRKKAGRAYVALARAQSEKNNLQLALELYRKAESYVPDNVKLKERIIEIEWAVKNGKPFNPSPKKSRRKPSKKAKKSSTSTKGNSTSAGGSAPSHQDRSDDELEYMSAPSQLKLGQKRQADDIYDPDAFVTPLKRSRREEIDVDDD